MMDLCRLDPKHAGDAWLLLTKLHYVHAARCRRSETFNIAPKDMAAAQTIPGWARERYERARDLLLKAGLIVRVRAYVRRRGRRGSGALYRFPGCKSHPEE